MNQITFTTKSYSDEFVLGNANYNYPINKPMLCPICGAYEDGRNKDRKVFTRTNNTRFGVVQYECTHCKENYLVVYDVDYAARKGSFGAFYPTATVAYDNTTLRGISSRFIDSYNQALRAENIGDIELAAIGYRNALECLVKDYAINVKNENQSDVVKKKLFDAIDMYLDSPSLIKSADVVRILGNDYTHYERKYPQHDFILLKKYMEIFISLIETQVMIANPPVSR